MAISMEKIKEKIESIREDQEKGIEGPCPRCSTFLKKPKDNPISKQLPKLRICNLCAYSEDRNPIPPSDWYFILTIQETPRNKLNNSECENGGCQA